MNIHEYQAREIFRDHGVPVPPGELASTPDEAAEIADRFGGGVVVKAQVHAGGRGKAGGVKLAANAAEAREAAGRILGMEIKGIEVRGVLVAPAEDIASEAYVGIVMDRGRQADVVMVSAEGGVDIEEVAATMPEAIHTATADPRYGLLPHQSVWLGYHLYDDPALARQASKVIGQLYTAYRDSGATLAEINPLIVNGAGEVKAIDAKMNIDDNALFRLPDIAGLRDVDAEDPAERRARAAGLSYIKLDGNVGCCVNGAGLAMATMDLVKYYGGDPTGADHRRSQCAFHPVQHLRWDHPVRRRGERDCRGDAADRPERSAHDPAHGDERGRSRRDPGGERLRGDGGHGPGRQDGRGARGDHDLIARSRAREDRKDRHES
jgi:succinyl-CoA synthetase beta subunit